MWHWANDAAEMDKAAEVLNTAWQAASQDIYNATQQQQQAQPGAENAENAPTSGTDNVQDVPYEEVKDDKK